MDRPLRPILPSLTTRLQRARAEIKRNTPEPIKLNVLGRAFKEHLEQTYGPKLHEDNSKVYCKKQPDIPYEQYPSTGCLIAAMFEDDEYRRIKSKHTWTKPDDHSDDCDCVHCLPF